jgi:hypothetical protein
MGHEEIPWYRQRKQWTPNCRPPSSREKRTAPSSSRRARIPQRRGSEVQHGTRPRCRARPSLSVYENGRAYPVVRGPLLQGTPLRTPSASPDEVGATEEAVRAGTATRTEDGDPAEYPPARERPGSTRTTMAGGVRGWTARARREPRPGLDRTCRADLASASRVSLCRPLRTGRRARQVRRRVRG